MIMEQEKIRDKLIPDCFGNVAGRVHCQVLNEDVCLYREKCPFYKTREQFEADRRKSSIRSMSAALTGRKSGRKIRCIETGRIYYSIRQAADEFRVCESAIRQVLSGSRPHCGGKRFEYV